MHVKESSISGTFTACCPGSCGELLQGEIAGRSFHVTAPVSAYTWATASWGVVGADNSLTARPKTRQALAELFDHLRLPAKLLADIDLCVSGDLRVGKGMASSTADIVAACAAVAGLVGVRLDCDELAAIALRVEPTDGVLYPGVVAFDHRGGGFLERLGAMPPLDVVVLDTGGSVDTVAFNNSVVAYSERESVELAAALDLLRQGIAKQDPRMLGEACTISARLNQLRLPKPQLEDVIKVARKHGAYGVTVAHSGTLIGVICDPANTKITGSFNRSFASLTRLGRLSLINGGFIGFEGSRAGYNRSNVMVTGKR